MFSNPLFPRCMMTADLFQPKNYTLTVQKFWKTAVSDEYVLGRQRYNSISCSAPGCSSYVLKFYMRNVLPENKMNYPDMFSKTVDAHWMCRPGSLLPFQSTNSLWYWISERSLHAKIFLEMQYVCRHGAAPSFLLQVYSKTFCTTFFNNFEMSSDLLIIVSAPCDAPISCSAPCV
jgi:hypothetical protein